jgi:hypothetical protein
MLLVKPPAARSPPRLKHRPVPFALQAMPKASWDRVEQAHQHAHDPTVELAYQ